MNDIPITNKLTARIGCAHVTKLSQIRARIGIIKPINPNIFLEFVRDNFPLDINLSETIPKIVFNKLLAIYGRADARPLDLISNFSTSFIKDGN